MENKQKKKNSVIVFFSLNNINVLLRFFKQNDISSTISNFIKAFYFLLLFLISFVISIFILAKKKVSFIKWRKN
jgi:hypothetical protein